MQLHILKIDTILMKGVYDGSRDLVKHFTTYHNLQKSQLKSIYDIETFVSDSKNYTKAITHLYISKEEIQSFRDNKIEWKIATEIKEIQKCH